MVSASGLRTVVYVVVGCAALAAGGCSATYYTEDADREVYEIVADKQDAALGRALLFSVEPDKAIQDFFGEAGKRGGPGPEAEPEGEPTEALPEPDPEAITITAADALRLAVLANRDYQTRKETVYLAALTLTFQRYLFRPHPFATGTVDLENDQGDRERSFAGTSEVGFSQRLADGALVTASLGLTALKYINQELGDTLSSTLDFSLQQPLWRGAGRRIVQENLIQSERNTLYAVRTFARFEKTFAVSVATQYLRVLERRQIVLNEWRNYQSLKEGRERAEWLAEADRLPEFQVDQAKQDELRAYNSWIVARESYLNALDNFKLVLGIPVESPVVLDPKDLERLAPAGLVEMEPGQADVGVWEAVAKALQERLDLANAQEGHEDAERKVVVAEDGLKGDVDLVASIGYASGANRGAQSARLAFHQGDYSIGLEIDLPIDRLSERNALRETQIDREQAGRALSLLEDQIVLQVREAYRGLEQSRQSYDIQQLSVELADRRVESTELLLQAGRASQRDVLESRRALVEARNALTRALVDHTIAGLEFQRDVGTLVVDQEGQIHGWSLSENP
ncbi:MAG: TolC family protein [Phycisphaerae bacterium]